MKISRTESEKNSEIFLNTFLSILFFLTFVYALFCYLPNKYLGFHL
uniref:Uncharacterized protein n=1 Tax=Anguilla anguilla TaxID=7936 RepID=A0A0E9STA6_ANGAN